MKGIREQMNEVNTLHLKSNLTRKEFDDCMKKLIKDSEDYYKNYYKSYQYISMLDFIEDAKGNPQR